MDRSSAVIGAGGVIVDAARCGAGHVIKDDEPGGEERKRKRERERERTAPGLGLGPRVFESDTAVENALNKTKRRITCIPRESPLQRS